MEAKNKNVGLIIIVVILLLACIGMGGFIFINKDKLTAQKNTTTTITNDNKNVEDKTTDTSTYEPIDTKTFDKKITQVLIDGSGQDATSATILYLMEDGTVEYVPILKDINTNWSQTDNTKKFNSYGKLNGVSDIISLIPAEAQGYHTDLARKVDGTVINLADALKATGNFN